MHPYQAKICDISSLQAGMRLASPVYDFNGKMLLSQGVVLSAKHISLLQNLLIMQVTIWEDRSPNLPEENIANEPEFPYIEEAFAEPEPVLDLSPRKEPITSSAPFQMLWDAFWNQSPQSELSMHYRRLLEETKHIFSSARLHSRLEKELLNTLAGDILVLTASPVQVLRCLHLHPRNSPYIFHHTLHVALLSALIGKQCDFSEERLQALTLSALLHDVGKLRISLEVLGKQQPLSEDEKEKVRLHSLLGFRFLQKQKEYDLPVLMGVLQHHERLDGSGYPLHTKSDKTHVFAKIIAIADVYDAMTSQKSYGTQHSAFVALDEIQSSILSGQLDTHCGQAFLKLMQNHLAGEWLELTDGRFAQLLFWELTGTHSLVVQTPEKEVLDLQGNHLVRPLRFIPPLYFTDGNTH